MTIHQSKEDVARQRVQRNAAGSLQLQLHPDRLHDRLPAVVLAAHDLRELVRVADSPVAEGLLYLTAGDLQQLGVTTVRVAGCKFQSGDSGNPARGLPSIQVLYMLCESEGRRMVSLDARKAAYFRARVLPSSALSSDIR